MNCVYIIFTCTFTWFRFPFNSCEQSNDSFGLKYTNFLFIWINIVSFVQIDLLFLEEIAFFWFINNNTSNNKIVFTCESRTGKMSSKYKSPLCESISIHTKKVSIKLRNMNLNRIEAYLIGSVLMNIYGKCEIQHVSNKLRIRTSFDR